MSELPWGSEVAEEARPDQHAEAPAGEPGTLAMSADDFSALEERVLRAVNLVKRERMARTAAEERAVAAEARASEAEARAEEHDTQIRNLERELNSLRGERDAVRQRVEKVLSQLDELEA